MARIPSATRESIPENQRDAYDQIIGERGGSHPAGGPIAIMINVPEITKRGEHLRAFLRGEDSSLSAKVRELAMLVTARELDCQYIWYAHAAAGRRSGLSDALVDSLRDKKELNGLSPDESAVVSYGQEFFRTHQVSQATFGAARTQFGVRGLTELTNLMGYYALLAFNVNAFGEETPTGGAEPLLLV